MGANTFTGSVVDVVPSYMSSKKCIPVPKVLWKSCIPKFWTREFDSAGQNRFVPYRLGNIVSWSRKRLEARTFLCEIRLKEMIKRRPSAVHIEKWGWGNAVRDAPCNPALNIGRWDWVNGSDVSGKPPLNIGRMETVSLATKVLGWKRCPLEPCS